MQYMYIVWDDQNEWDVIPVITRITRIPKMTRMKGVTCVIFIVGK